MSIKLRHFYLITLWMASDEASLQTISERIKIANHFAK